MANDIETNAKTLAIYVHEIYSALDTAVSRVEKEVGGEETDVRVMISALANVMVSMTCDCAPSRIEALRFIEQVVDASLKDHYARVAARS